MGRQEYDCPLVKAKVTVDFHLTISADAGDGVAGEHAVLDDCSHIGEPSCPVHRFGEHLTHRTECAFVKPGQAQA